MAAQQVTVYVAICDGCGRELGAGYGHRETFDTQRETVTAALNSGWSTNPDGTLSCLEGNHP